MPEPVDLTIIIILILALILLFVRSLLRQRDAVEASLKAKTERDYIAKGRQEKFEKYWTEGLTDREDLAQPANAIKLLGYEIGVVWMLITEYRYRYIHNDYPPDWAWRRHFVLTRDGWKCTKCGEKVLTLHCHHIKPISKGGTHELENLKTLCIGCHSDEHPDNEKLRTQAGRTPGRTARSWARPQSGVQDRQIDDGAIPIAKQIFASQPENPGDPPQVRDDTKSLAANLSAAPRPIIKNEKLIYDGSISTPMKSNQFPLGTKKNFVPIGQLNPPPGRGIYFSSATFQQHVGEETVLILVDERSFLATLERRGAYDLRLNSGAANTSAGPVLFLLWWFPPKVDNLPFAAYELHLDPTGTSVLNIVRRAAHQTHLHLLIFDEDHKIFGVVEFPNNYFLERLVEIAEELRPQPKDYNFASAEDAFMQEISQTELF